MDSKTLSQIRVCIEYWTSIQKRDAKYVWLDTNDKYSDILKKSTVKFGIEFENALQKEYSYYTKTHLCKITDAEDLMLDDIIIMVSREEESKTLRYFNDSLKQGNDRKMYKKVLLKRKNQSPISITDYSYQSEDFLNRSGDHPSPYSHFFEDQEVKNLFNSIQRKEENKDEEGKREVNEENEEEKGKKDEDQEVKESENNEERTESETDEEEEDEEDSEEEEREEESFFRKKISIKSIKEEEYSDRENLINEIKLWAAKKKFKLTLLTGEKQLKKEECYVTTFYCAKHQETKCNFKLVFKSYFENCEEKEDCDTQRCYKLEEWTRYHNHKLDKNHYCDRITPEIIDAIKRLRGRCKNDGALTD